MIPEHRRRIVCGIVFCKPTSRYLTVFISKEDIHLSKALSLETVPAVRHSIGS